MVRVLAEIDPATDRAAWLDARRGGIGGSDAPAIVGLSPWDSPWTVYLRKTGELTDDDEPTEAQRFGLALEAVVADEYARRHPERMVTRRRAILQHDEHPWMIFTPDRLVRDPEHGRGGLQIKTASAFKAGEWGDDEAPDGYVVQCLHEMAVYGADWWDLAVLIGGNRYREYRIWRDDEAIAALIKWEAEFWDRVQRRDPPMADGAKSTTEALQRLYAEVLAADDTVDLDGDAAEQARAYVAAREAESAAKAAKAEAANRLRQALGHHQVGLLDGRPAVRWSRVKGRTSFDVDAFKADHPDLYAEYVRTGEPTRRLTVSAKALQP